MKNQKLFVLSILLLVALGSQAWAQTGKVYDSLTMESKILGGERNYAVYLPPDYETSTRSYPTLYLLHGAGDNQTGWVQFGEVLHIADKAIREGKATPMIIVMPDADTGRRGYFNDVRGDWNYEDHFFEELIPHVQEKFRIRDDKRYRAVAGLSMGGGGTFMYALHHPELFAAACPLSASTGSRNVEDVKRRMNRRRASSSDQGDAAPVSDEALTAYVENHNAISLVENMPDNQREAVRWYIDCGDDDFLYEGNALVHIAMRKRNVPHEYRVRDGGHRWGYWREALPNVLAFVSESFHQR